MHSWALIVLATWCYHSVSTGEIHIYLSIYTGVSPVFAIRFLEDMKILPNAYTRTVEYSLVLLFLQHAFCTRNILYFL